ncbi:hypothetical protein V5O48_011599, partial [Marasmius crinis-equi]
LSDNILSLRALDFATTILTSEYIRITLVKHFGKTRDMLRIHTVLNTEYLITVIITVLVQLFFASRVYLLRGIHISVPVSVVVCAFGGLGVACIIAARGYENEFFSAQWSSTITRVEVGVSGALQSLADILTTISLSWYFVTMRTGLPRTDTLMVHLYRFVVARGILVSVIQIAHTIVFLVFDPKKFYWAPFHLMLSKIYVVTMVAMLNNRASLRGSDSVVDMGEIIRTGEVRFANTDLVTSSIAYGQVVQSTSSGESHEHR